MIDSALENAKDFDAFLAAMRAAGCEVKRGKNLAFRIPGADRFARCRSLGEDYTEEAIKERISGLRTVRRKADGDGYRPPADEPFVPFVITSETRFSLLIDIQKKVSEGKGKAYENWAKIYNLKQMAKTLIYLQENKTYIHSGLYFAARGYFSSMISFIFSSLVAIYSPSVLPSRIARMHSSSPDRTVLYGSIRTSSPNIGANIGR